MAASLSIIAAKDGTGTTIAGGLQALDLSGAGTGPWSLANVLVDGVSGSNRLAVTASNAMKVDGSAVTQPVSGTVTAQVKGNAGGVFDFAGQNAAAPANAILIGGEFNTSPTTITSGNASPLQLDNAGNLKVNVAAGVNANGQTNMAGGAPVTIASNQSTLAVAQDTTQIADGASGTMLTPTKTKVSVASATTSTIVAAVASKKIRILAAYLVAGAANNINWQSHTTTSNADGVQDFAANGGIVLPFNPLGWFETTAGEALDLVTSTSAQVGGLIVTVAV